VKMSPENLLEIIPADLLDTLLGNEHDAQTLKGCDTTLNYED